MTAKEAVVDLRERNRRVLWIWLAVAGVLVVASFVVGIRW